MLPFKTEPFFLSADSKSGLAFDQNSSCLPFFIIQAVVLCALIRQGKNAHMKKPFSLEKRVLIVPSSYTYQTKNKEQLHL